MGCSEGVFIFFARSFFAAETADARRTGAHSYKPPADPDLKWILLALDAAAAGSKDLELAAGSSFTSGPRIKLARGANATTTAPCLMSGRGDRLRPAQTALDSDAVGTELNGFNGCPSDTVSLRKLGRPDKGCDGGGMPRPPTPPKSRPTPLRRVRPVAGK